jgi:hypothetical protein
MNVRIVTISIEHVIVLNRIVEPIDEPMDDDRMHTTRTTQDTLETDALV